MTLKIMRYDHISSENELVGFFDENNVTFSSKDIEKRFKEETRGYPNILDIKEEHFESEDTILKLFVVGSYGNKTQSYYTVMVANHIPELFFNREV